MEHAARRPRRRWVRYLAVGLASLLAVAFLGPRPRIDEGVSLPPLPAQAKDLGDWLREQEAAYPDLREGAEARLTWAGEIGQRTPWSIVYLHGFSACPAEIDPVIGRVAERLAANAYWPRLDGHGRGVEAFALAKAGNWLAQARQAVEVGRLLGEHVLLVGLSTGATLAGLVALENPDVGGLVAISPNFGPAIRSSELALLPWAHLVLPAVLPAHTWMPRNDAHGHFWTTTYPIEAVGQMMLVVEASRRQDWSKLEVPTLVLHCQADPIVQQEPIVAWAQSIPGGALLEIPAVAEEDNHVLTGDILSPSRTGRVVNILCSFVRGLEGAPSNTPR